MSQKPKQDPYLTARVYDYVKANPMSTYKELADHFCITRAHAMMKIAYLAKREIVKGYKPFVILTPYTKYNLRREL